MRPWNGLSFLLKPGADLVEGQPCKPWDTKYRSGKDRERRREKQGK
jgi:hypothetical protein